MKFNNILPIAIVATLMITGCSSSNDEQTCRDTFYPSNSCYSSSYTQYSQQSNGYTVLRGAPIDPKYAGLVRQTYITAFPSPRIPRQGIGHISPRNLYSNLTNKNPQVRSDTLYVIDTILSDKEKREEYPQVQGILDDYIQNMKKNNHDKAEYETAKNIYQSHFPEKGNNELNRPNWTSKSNDDFGRKKLIEDMEKIEKAPYNHVNQAELNTNGTGTTSGTITGTDAATDGWMGGYEDAKTPAYDPENDKYIYKAEEMLDNNPYANRSPINPDEIPEFDFSDPKNNDFVQKTELEIQMERNNQLSSIKETEDMIIDESIYKITTSTNLSDWNCSRQVCESRLSAIKNNAGDLIKASKIVLNDKTQPISPRLRAICSLKCASVADEKYEPEVVNYLASYLRRRTPWIIPAKGKKAPPIKAVRPDVQAALYVIGARDRNKDVGFDINLVGTDLRGADLSYANLYNTNLSFTNLSSSNLDKAYGLMDWNKVYLSTIDVTTKIPESISAGFVVTKKPSLPIQPVGSYKVITDDWIWWNATPIK